MTLQPLLPLPPAGSTAILGCVREISEALDRGAGAQPLYLTTAEKAQVLVELERLQARLAELQLRVLAVAEDVAEQAGARDAAAWLAHQARRDGDAARADARLASAFDTSYVRLRSAVADGAVSIAQARVIVRVLEDLPADLDADVVTRAEGVMVGYAADYNPSQLRRLGRHLLDVVAPEIAEQAEARRLADAEAHAETKTRLSLRPVGDGTTRLSGVLPDLDATRLRIYLEALTSPRASSGQAHRDGAASGNPDLDRLPHPRRMGHAFRSLIGLMDPTDLPQHGGLSTTLMVTMSLDQLRAEVATAGLLDDPNSEITANQARRLACGAGIIPVVLDGDSQILDLGRQARLFTTAQRKALRLRDHGCRTEGCNTPATWTEAHHLQPWANDGPTDLNNAISLCNFHHHRAHDPDYAKTRLPNGDLRFHRRT